MINKSTLKQVQDIIARETNHDLEEVLPESNFNEDLGLEVSEDADEFKKIIKHLNRHFEIELDQGLFINTNFENQTVAYLTELVRDEVEL